MSESILITGASGFLGRHLTRHLTLQGHQVSILARATSDLQPFKDLNVRVVRGDITNRLSLLQACENKDRVYHLAGYIAYRRSERQLMEKINVQGTANVVDACITHQTPKLLHLSSVVTIGANTRAKPLNEDSHYNLQAYNLGYFETKRKAEDLVLKAHKENQLSAYIVNPSTIYGAGDATKGSRKTQIKVAQGRFPFIPPGGVNVVHVQDVIEGLDLCLAHGRPGRRYILAGENLLLRDLFYMIADISGVKPPSWPLPRVALTSLGWLGDNLRKMGKETSLSSETAITASLYHWFSSERAQRELGFQPRPAREAIEESLQWMKQQGLV